MDNITESQQNEIKSLKQKLNEKTKEAENLEKVNQGLDNNRSKFEKLAQENMKYKKILNDLIKNYNKANQNEIKLILANIANSSKKGNLFEDYKDKSYDEGEKMVTEFDQLLDKQIKRVESYYNRNSSGRKYTYSKRKGSDGQRNYAIYKHKKDQEKWKNSLRGWSNEMLQSSDVDINVLRNSSKTRLRSRVISKDFNESQGSIAKEDSNLYFFDRLRSTSPKKSILNRIEKTEKEQK
jgi:hypothetical protein